MEIHQHKVKIPKKNTHTHTHKKQKKKKNMRKRESNNLFYAIKYVQSERENSKFIVRGWG